MENLDFLGDEEPERLGVSGGEDGREAEHRPEAEISGGSSSVESKAPQQVVAPEDDRRRATEPPLEAVHTTDEARSLTIAELAERQESFRLDISERLAAMAHGRDVTEAAKAWALEQPADFRRTVRTLSDPYDYLVRLYRNSRPESQTPVPTPQAPPRSQAMTPSAGSSRTPYLSDEDAFDSAFSKRK